MSARRTPISHCDARTKGDCDMTAQGASEVLKRAQDEPEFRHLLQTEPDRAMHGYDIEPDERAAIISGDAARLRQLGVGEALSDLAPDYNPTRQEPTQP
jgi:hypothetical protein